MCNLQFALPIWINQLNNALCCGWIYFTFASNNYCWIVSNMYQVVLEIRLLLSKFLTIVMVTETVKLVSPKVSLLVDIRKTNIKPTSKSHLLSWLPRHTHNVLTFNRCIISNCKVENNWETTKPQLECMIFLNFPICFIYRLRVYVAYHIVVSFHTTLHMFSFSFGIDTIDYKRTKCVYATSINVSSWAECEQIDKQKYRVSQLIRSITSVYSASLAYIALNIGWLINNNEAFTLIGVCGISSIV